MDSIKNFLSDISNGKFKIGYNKINDTIKNDSRFEIFNVWINKKYVAEGRGIKSIIKDYELPVNYSFMRRLLMFLGFSLHSNVEANDFLRKRRSKIAHNHLI